jgi:hypothetical protein
VRQLMFDMFNTLLEHFVKDGPRRSSESHAGFVFLYPNRCRIFAARPRSSACWAAHSRKNILAAPVSS